MSLSEKLTAVQALLAAETDEDQRAWFALCLSQLEHAIAMRTKGTE